MTVRFLRSSALAVVFAAGLAGNSFAQTRDSGQPVRPSMDLTVQKNPRGADIVEPAIVYKASFAESGTEETRRIGVAKIPDPKKNEIGAIVSTDIETGVTIRLGDAWIYDDSGRRTAITFEEGDRLVFHPGRHDDVISLQGVLPLDAEVGHAVTFDLQELYEATTLHPVTGAPKTYEPARLRLARLRMQSTFPRGEAVDLNIILEPISRPAPAPQAIRVVHRDTVLVSADLNYVIQEEVIEESPWTAAVAVESGVGQASLSSEVPATRIPAFTDKGSAGTYYVDGTIYLRRGESRWALHALGISSVNQTSFIRMANHQVALYADARFEHGTHSYVLVQASGELTDKLHQEFDWNSADYAGEVTTGFGRRFFSAAGFEKSRVEFLVGVRMGENRRIEVLELRGKSRGLGPYALLRGDLTKPLGPKTSLHAGLQASGYSIFGLGPQDEGFAEKGLNVTTDLKVGRNFLGVTLRGGVTAMWGLKRADLVHDMHYLENRLLIAPGLSMETYL